MKMKEPSGSPFKLWKARDWKGKVEKPKIEVSVATATTTDFDVVFKVTSKEMPSVTLHYGTTSSCNNSSTCRLYNDGRQTRFLRHHIQGLQKAQKSISMVRQAIAVALLKHPWTIV